MISPTLGAALAEPVADIYRDAELRILERIAWSLQAGIDAPDWEVQQLMRLQRVRAEVLAELEAINPAAAAVIRLAIESAYTTGGLSAFQDVGTTVPHVEASPDARANAVAVLAADTIRGVASGQSSILRAVDDVYRDVIAKVVSQVVVGTTTREAAVQSALEQFLGKGLTTIPTRRGRMSLADYATMAVRTATVRSAISGQVDTNRQMGLDLVVIHPGPRACDICDRWARSVLTTGSQVGRLMVDDLGKGGQVSVDVDATLDEARAAGWGHPNCRCGMHTYLPGVTERDIIERPEWDQEGYEAQQRQRAIERQVRGWKVREAIAVTDTAKAESRERVKAWQGAMREHLDQHPDLKRQSAREQITGNLTGNPDGARPLRRVTPAAPAPRPAPRPKPSRPTAPKATPAPSAPAPTSRVEGVDARSMSNAQKIKAAEIMYGTDSPQHREAKRRWK